MRYQEIESWLRGQIRSGRAGDLLPSEVQLCRRFGVSRMTVRQAMQNLAAEGLVRRRRGVGTFIGPPPAPPWARAGLGFTEQMRRRGRSPSSRLLCAELREPSATEAAALRLGGRERVVSIVRVRLADDAPTALETATLRPDCAPVLAHDLESGSLHEALGRLGRAPAAGQSSISARSARAEEARLLGLPPRSAVLVDQRVVSEHDGRPVEFVVSVYHAGRFAIDAACTPL